MPFRLQNPHGGNGKRLGQDFMSLPLRKPCIFRTNIGATRSNALTRTSRMAHWQGLKWTMLSKNDHIAVTGRENPAA